MFGQDGLLLWLRLGGGLWSFHLLALGSLVPAVGLTSSSSIDSKRYLKVLQLSMVMSMLMFQTSFKSRVYGSLEFDMDSQSRGLNLAAAEG